MKRVLVLCAVLAVVAPTLAFAQEAAKEPPKVEKVDVSGAWDLAIETPQGTMALTATYKQDGEKLTGTQTGPMGEDKLEGTIKGADIAYVIVFNMQGQEIDDRRTPARWTATASPATWSSGPSARPRGRGSGRSSRRLFFRALAFLQRLQHRCAS